MNTVTGKTRKNRLRGTKKNESLVGIAGDDILLGLAGNDTLKGNQGNDFLDGGGGKDWLIGGQGNDIYVIDNADDRVLEKRAQGTDSVRSSVSWTLGAHLENLELTGAAAINGIGNALDNVITGNAASNQLLGGKGDDGLFGGGGNDRLDGGTGSDTMLGGAGDDVYLIDDSVDLISEKAIDNEQQFINIGNALPSLPDAGGIDLVQSTIDYILPQDTSINGAIENLELLGSAALNGIGNSLNNSIRGNAGSNILYGVGGDDALNGGAGNDFLFGDSGDDVIGGGAGDDLLFGGDGFDGFLFTTSRFFSGGDIGTDTINDFSSSQDLIALSKQTFGLSSSTNSSLTAFGDFATVSSDTAASNSSALIVYSTLTGFLYFNPNRSESGFGVPNNDAAFALVLTELSVLPPRLTSSDFLVV